MARHASAADSHDKACLGLDHHRQDGLCEGVLSFVDGSKGRSSPPMLPAVISIATTTSLREAMEASKLRSTVRPSFRSCCSALRHDK